MKPVIKTIVSAITITAITVSSVFAMVPRLDLKNNTHPDIGRASIGMYVLDSDATNLPELLREWGVTNQDVEERLCL